MRRRRFVRRRRENFENVEINVSKPRIVHYAAWSFQVAVFY
jgi:hypothetical protein